MPHTPHLTIAHNQLHRIKAKAHKSPNVFWLNQFNELLCTLNFNYNV